MNLNDDEIEQLYYTLCSIYSEHRDCSEEILKWIKKINNERKNKDKNEEFSISGNRIYAGKSGNVY